MQRVAQTRLIFSILLILAGSLTGCESDGPAILAQRANGDGSDAGMKAGDGDGDGDGLGDGDDPGDGDATGDGDAMGDGDGRTNARETVNKLGRSVPLPQITSVPPLFTVANERYRYTPRHTVSGEVSWRVAKGPAGMSITDKGRVEWDPSEVDSSAHSMPHEVELEGTVDDTVLKQAFKIDVGRLVQRAKKTITPDRDGEVAVTAPGSKIKGGGIFFPSGALKQSKDISISELDKGPKFPNRREQPKMLDFSPSGLKFAKSAMVTLPFRVADDKPKSSRVAAYTYDSKLGRWKSLPPLSLDLAAGVIQARASHFSLYAAAVASADYEVLVEEMDGSSICEGRLAARGELADGLSSLDIASVNNLSDAMQALGSTTVMELVSDAGFVGSLRFARLFKLTTSSGATSQKTLVSTLWVDDQGATLVHTDGFANIIASQIYDDPMASLAEIDEHLSGLAAHVFFDAAFADADASISGSLHIIYSEADQSLVGAAEDAIGPAAMQVAEGSASMPAVVEGGFDVDCDRYRGGYDEVDDSLQPTLSATPSEPKILTAGRQLLLTVRAQGADAPPTDVVWELLKGDANARLDPAMDDPESRLFSARSPGFYTVRMSATVDGVPLATRFNLMVQAAPAINTPPSCDPALVQDVVSTSEVAHVFANVDDRETPDDSLVIEWGLAVSTASGMQLMPSASFRGEGTAVGFSSAAPGSFEIGCRAFDGDDWGDIGVTTLGVVPPDSNRPPVDVALSPIAAEVLVGATVSFTGRGVDPDGDTLTYAWSTPFPASAVSGANSARLTVDTTNLTPGSHSISMSVTDGPSQPQLRKATLRILAAPLPADATDADQDGFPVSLDCADDDATINPDAVEVCGNTLDEDCDGVALQSDCDGDGYAVDDPTAPDCDDENPRTHPLAFEYCDGLDNDCDTAVDEDYGLGDACTTGLGVCANEGMSTCTPDQQNAVCAAAPLASTPETCDGLDNDCNGAADDGDICLLERTGVWLNCVPNDANCSGLAGDGFELTDTGEIRMLRDEQGKPDFDPNSALCEEDRGSISFSGDSFTVMLTDTTSGGSYVVMGKLTLLGGDLGLLEYTDPDSGAQVQEYHRRRNPMNVGGPCPDPCAFDDDQDGKPNCEDPCPQDNQDLCVAGGPDAGTGDWCLMDDDGDGTTNCNDVCPHDSSKQTDAGVCGCRRVLTDSDSDGTPETCLEIPCDADGFDNDNDSTVDESGEPCFIPCDQDGVDNDNDGMVDEAAEQCFPPCDRDGIDNDGDGTIDQLGEPCEPPCDTDGIDNDDDGTVDEPGEACFVSCDNDSIDNDGDGVIDQPGEPCGPPCDLDGVDNNQDGIVDELGEPCGGPACDADGFDNDGNGQVDETGEPCAPFCDQDGFDNDGNGQVDEAGEPCGPPCDADGMDNNLDGQIDETGEPCGRPFCDADGLDNNNDGTIDESGEFCVFICDFDGVDNDLDGMTDMPGEPCGVDHCAVDYDQDGLKNCEDGCILDPQADCDPCATDDDQDGTPNCSDLCPLDASDSCWCAMDNDQDGTPNCVDVCPDDPTKVETPGTCGCHLQPVDTDSDGIDDQCLPAICDFDGWDNNGDGQIDESGEPCLPTVCDFDGRDNNGDGQVDETGEPCDYGLCDSDGVDNNWDGMVDELGEHCPPLCDFDGVDNNGDGTVDEPSELCPFFCDFDGVDNNGDGTIDEQSEPCDGVCDTDTVDNDLDTLTDEAGEPCYPVCDGDGLDNNANGLFDEPGEPCP